MGRFGQRLSDHLMEQNVRRIRDSCVKNWKVISHDQVRMAHVMRCSDCGWVGRTLHIVKTTIPINGAQLPYEGLGCPKCKALVRQGRVKEDKLCSG